MIGILTNVHWYALDALVATTPGGVGNVDTGALGLPGCPPLYDLPSVTEGSAVVIEAAWLHSLVQQGVDLPSQVFQPLRARFDRIIGVEHANSVQLHLRHEILEQLDVLLKNGGIYHDRELYNYDVGVGSAEGNWTSKVQAKQQRHPDVSLARIRRCLTCLVSLNPNFRALVRPLYCRSRARRLAVTFGERLVSLLPRPALGSRPPRLTAHFYGSLTHVQRAEAVRRLKKSRLQWQGGITGVNRQLAGREGRLIETLAAEERERMQGDLEREGLIAPPQPKPAYYRSIQESKAVISLVGHGEICFRMAEAWQSRRILVCQDLSHVDTGYPFRPGENVVFCRPDLSDLVDILDDIESNYPRYRDIGEQGYQDWLGWCRNTQEMIAGAFAPVFG